VAVAVEVPPREPSAQEVVVQVQEQVPEDARRHHHVASAPTLQ
jgi:hypothetical protein